jgi:crotonobetainyl-CoA:carnitine CoA-transferase CaiB-like acyl-CoA transferase
MEMAKSKTGPLAGVRVLELTKVWAGPYAGKQLAFLGAESIRVESLGSLDVTRVFGGVEMNKAPGFRAVNPQKLSVQIDMKSPEGLKLLRDLASKCDILIENLRPGAIDRLGLGYETVKQDNPGIVYVSMGMYGNDGPLSYQTGYAPCFVALGGVSALVGYEGEAPRGMNIRYADSTFGTAAAYAAVVALMHKRRTGIGQYVDLSAVECASSVIGDTIMDYTLNGKIAFADGNKHAEMAPHGVYPCQGKDWIAIAISSEKAWASLCEAMGSAALADDPRFATLADRKKNEAALNDIVAAWTAPQDAKTLAAKLQSHGIAAAKSANSVDLASDEHLWGRGFFPMVTDREGNVGPVLGPSWRMTEPAEITDAAPALGQHNAYVFGEILGLSPKEQERLAAAGAIR